MLFRSAISYISRRFPQQRGYALSIHALGANSGDALAPMAVGAALVWLTWSQAATAACVPILAVALLLFLALPRQSNSERAQSGAGEGMDLATYFKGLTTLLCDRAVDLYNYDGFFNNMPTCQGLRIYVYENNEYINIPNESNKYHFRAPGD